MVIVLMSQCTEYLSVTSWNSVVISAF